MSIALLKKEYILFLLKNITFFHHYYIATREKSSELMKKFVTYVCKLHTIAPIKETICKEYTLMTIFHIDRLYCWLSRQLETVFSRENIISRPSRREIFDVVIGGGLVLM